MSIRSSVSLRAASLAIVGLLAIAVPAALALEAWRAAREHRASAERALRDHAQYAAVAFRQRFISRVYAPLTAVLGPIGNARRAYPAGALPDVALMRQASESARACAECGPQLVPVYYFRVTLNDSALTIDGPPLDARRRAWLVHEMTDLGPLRDARDWEIVTSVDTLAAEPQLVYATMRRGPEGEARAMYGFAVDFATLVPTMLRPIMDGGPMLPNPGEPELPNDSLLSVTIIAPDSARRLELSPVARAATYSATIPGGGFLGAWQIRVSLDERRAPPLLIGGLPPSRTSLIVLLAALMVALIGATLVVAWRALALARLRAEFVASVSHELRTPLAQILLFGETLTLGRMQSRDQVRSAAGIIVGEARRLMQLVDNVLLFGRGLRGTRGPVTPPDEQPLAPIVHEVIESFAPLAAAGGSKVVVVRADDVAAAVDPASLRQVLLNVLDNAVKYGPAGQTIQVGLALAGDVARLWIEDEGPGIPSPDRDRVWQPFVRLDRDADRAAGSGIGLSVVRDIVERHRGVARIEESGAGGTRVVIELPGARSGAAVRCAS